MLFVRYLDLSYFHSQILTRCRQTAVDLVVLSNLLYILGLNMCEGQLIVVYLSCLIPCLEVKSDTLDQNRLTDLPKIHDQRGNLTFIEECDQIPFKIKRVYYVYDIPGGETTGGHAHKQQQEFLIAATGSFDVILDDRTNKNRFRLNTIHD